MASSINADNGVISGSSGLKSTADASGVLALQSNGTTGLTLNTSLAVGVGSSPSYGTSGQVLTSGGSAAAPTWSTPASAGSGGSVTSGSQTLTSASNGAIAAAFTDYGQYIKLPDATTMTAGLGKFTISNTSAYPGLVIDNASTTVAYLQPYTNCTIALADISTAAGTWIITSSNGAAPVGLEAASAITTIGANAMDLSTYYVTQSNGQTGSDVYALTGGNFLIKGTLGCVIYNPVTRQFGTPWVNTSEIGISMLDGTSAIVTYVTSLVIKARVLTFSGTTITANAEATATAEVTGARPYPLIAATSATNGVILYYEGSAATQYGRMRGFSVSGTTVTIGAASAQFGSVSNATGGKGIIAISSSSVLTYVCGTTSGGTFCAATVSGSTVTIGTAVAWSSSCAMMQYRTPPEALGALGNGKWLFATCNTSTSELVTNLVAVSGTTVTVTSVTPGNLITQSSMVRWTATGTTSSVLQFVYGASYYIQVFQNSTGTTLTAGSATSNNYQSGYYPMLPVFPVDSGGRFCWFYESMSSTYPTYTGLQLIKYSVSGTSFSNYNTALRLQTQPVNGYTDFGVPCSVLASGTKRYMIGRAGTIVWDSDYTYSTFIATAKQPGLQALVVNSSASNLGFFGNAWGIIVVGCAK